MRRFQSHISEPQINGLSQLLSDIAANCIWVLTDRYHMAWVVLIQMPMYSNLPPAAACYCSRARDFEHYVVRRKIRAVSVVLVRCPANISKFMQSIALWLINSLGMEREPLRETDISLAAINLTTVSYRLPATHANF